MRGTIFNGSAAEKILGEVLEPAEIIADIGCGTGELIPLLKNFGKRVIGVDRSQRMLEIAASSAEGDPASTELRLGEIEHLPMRDSEINTAVMNMVLHYLPSPEDALAETARVIQKNGTLVILDLIKHDREEMRSKYNHRWLGFEINSLESQIQNTGFHIETVKEFNLKGGMKAFLIKCRKG